MTKYIKIKTCYIKLGQLLKFAGVAETGGHARDLIEEGLVKVNGHQCTVRGKKLFPGDKVEIEDYELLIEG